MLDKDLHARLATQALDWVPNAYLRRLPTREVFCLPGPHGAQLVAKRSRESWAGSAASPAAQERAILEALRQLGIAVPRPLAHAERREGPLQVARRSVLLLEWVAHEQTLRERLRSCDPREMRHWARELAAMVVRLHSTGWYHRDLYLQHFVLSNEQLVLLDLGRARQTQLLRERWFIKDLAALIHSTPRAVSLRARLEFWVRYARGRGLGRRARARLLRKAQAKERRMAGHRPKYGEEGPWTDR